MSTIHPFPNPHGPPAAPVPLPADAAEAMAANARNCRFDLAEIEAARMAGMGMACASSEPMPLAAIRRPYIPAGCDQQGRRPSGMRAMTHEEVRGWPWGEHSRPGPLTEETIDRQVRAKMERGPSTCSSPRPFRCRPSSGLRVRCSIGRCRCRRGASGCGIGGRGCAPNVLVSGPEL